MTEQKTDAAHRNTVEQIVRCIRFDVLCANCHRNGKNHQEYGRLCPSPDQCLVTRGPKTAEDCPIWRTLKAQNAALTRSGE